MTEQRSTRPSATRAPHAPHGIVPPHVLERIREHGTEGERARAAATLDLDTLARAQRAVAPPLAEHEEHREHEAAPAPAVRREIHDGRHRMRLPGPLVRAEGDESTDDRDVNRVYRGFGATWNLYHQVYGRDSFDDAGAPLVGTVNFGRDYDNAFWDGTQMVFGDGDGELFRSFTASVDIMAHELTHAVTEHESGLEYQGQSGALNESLSDVFGSLVKQRAAEPAQTAEEADWLIGEGIFGRRINGVALRSMKAPGTAYDDPMLGRDPQPAHMDDYVRTRDDSGGVHINSGIPNHAFYLFAIAVGGHAWKVAGAVWYAAATDRGLPSNATFKKFAQLTANHALRDHGLEVARACRRAWHQVGIEVALPQDVADPAA